MNRVTLEQRIKVCEQVKADNPDHPELVERMDDKLDLLNEWRDSIPEQSA